MSCCDAVCGGGGVGGGGGMFPRGCAIFVRRLSDFPDPVAGIITLAEETCYVICGFIVLGENTLALSDGTTLRGACGPDTDALLRVAGGVPMFTLASTDASVHIYDLLLSNASGPVFDFAGDGGNTVDVQRCVLNGSLSLGTILSVAILSFVKNAVSGNLGGLGVSSIALANFTENLIVSNLGPFTFLTATGLSFSYRVDNNTHIGSGTQVFLDIDVTLAAGGRGLVSNNAVQLGTTPLTGTVTPASLGWLFTGNLPYGIFNSRALAETSFSTVGVAPAPNVVVIGVIGTPVAIPGAPTPFVLSLASQRFTETAPGNGILVYTGADAVQVRVVGRASFSGGGAVRINAGLTIAHNGVAVPRSQARLSVAAVATSAQGAVTTVLVLDLDPGDTLQLMLQNNFNTNPINVFSAGLEVDAALSG